MLTCGFTLRIILVRRARCGGGVVECLCMMSTSRMGTGRTRCCHAHTLRTCSANLVLLVGPVGWRPFQRRRQTIHIPQRFHDRWRKPETRLCHVTRAADNALFRPPQAHAHLGTQPFRNHPLSDQHSFAADRHALPSDHAPLANHRLRLKRTSGRPKAICQKPFLPRVVPLLGNLGTSVGNRFSAGLSLLRHAMCSWPLLANIGESQPYIAQSHGLFQPTEPHLLCELH